MTNKQKRIMWQYFMARKARGVTAGDQTPVPYFCAAYFSFLQRLVDQDFLEKHF